MLHGNGERKCLEDFNVVVLNVPGGATIEDSIVSHHARQAVAGQGGDDVWRISVFQMIEERGHKLRKPGLAFFACGEDARSQGFVVNVAERGAIEPERRWLGGSQLAVTSSLDVWVG